MKKPHRTLPRNRLLIPGLLTVLPFITIAQETSVAPIEGEPIRLSQFVVTSDTAVGYRSLDSISGTNTRISLRDLPQSITVFNEEFLRDTGANSLMESVAFSASTSVNSTNQFNRVTFAIRGYESQTLRDGFSWFLGNDAYNVERVEVVKGPAAVLYGSSQPGGFVNTISKRPLRDARASVRATVGSYSKRRAEIDVNRPIVGDKLLFRFLAAYDHFDTHRDFENTENVWINPVVTWIPFEKVNLTVRWERNQHRHVPVNGLPINNPQTAWVNVPISWNNAGPAVFEDMDVDAFNADLQVEINERISFRNQTTLVKQDREELRRAINRLGVSGAPNDGRSLAAAINYGYERRESFSNKAELVIEFGNGSAWENKTLIGTQYNDSFVRQVGPLRIPGFTTGELTHDVFTLNRPFEQYYAIAPGPNWLQFDASRYTQVLGGDLQEGSDSATYIVNHLWFRDHMFHLQAGVRFGDDLFDFGSEETVPQVGFVFQPNKQWSFYALYNESYVPQRGTNQQTGEPFPPQVGEAKEIGFKAEFLEGRVGVNAAYFDIDRSGIIRRNTSIPGLPFDEASGLENSTGFEFEAYWSPNRNYRIFAGYTNLDAVVVSNVQFPTMVGTPTQNAPEHKFTLFNKYTFNDGALRGFSFGGGVIAQSESQSFAQADRLELKNESFIRLDASIGYSTKVFGRPANFQLNLRNLLDEEYREIQARFAPPFNWTLSADIRF